MLDIIFSKKWEGGIPEKDNQLLIVLQEETTFQELSTLSKKICRKKNLPLVHDLDFLPNIGYRGISQILVAKGIEIYSVTGKTLSYHDLPHIYEKDELPLINTLAVIVTDITDSNLYSKLIRRAKTEGFHFVVSPNGIKQISDELPQIDFSKHINVLV